MQKLNRVLILATAVLMVGAFDVWAQPGEGRRGERGGGGRGGAMMAMRSVPVEQVLGFLAFDEKVALSDEQLGKVRSELKGIYTERAALLEKLRGSQDREAAMSDVRKLRSQMLGKLTGVLNEKQVEGLKAYMQEMGQRGGGRGGEGGGRRGGGA